MQRSMADCYSVSVRAAARSWAPRGSKGARDASRRQYGERPLGRKPHHGPHETCCVASLVEFTKSSQFLPQSERNADLHHRSACSARMERRMGIS